MCVKIAVGDTLGRNDLLARLVDIQYNRNDTSPQRGEFRVRGDIVDVYEPQRSDFVRIGFFGDEVEFIERRDSINGKVKMKLPLATLFPCKQFVLPRERIEQAAHFIKEEMAERVAFFEKNNLLVEAQRLHQRVTYDIEMMKELGYCSGIENYSMHLSSRRPGARPYCLFDFFPDEFLTIIDESHVTLPQLQAMYKADRHRKEVLIDHGFRLPSALENRPLMFEEFEAITRETVYVSATPGEYELSASGAPVELVVRPTGLLDPEIEIRPLENQVDDVIGLIRETANHGERTLVTTLTKKSSERLADYLSDLGIRACYLHSDLDALERVRILNKLRDGEYDCMIGINLLREGIDLPEVAMVAILDADKVGFLRSERALIQTAGRAARNEHGKVVLYADDITPSIQALLDLTAARRKKQIAYNLEHSITPRTVVKKRSESISDIIGAGSPKKSGKKMPHLADTMLDGSGFDNLDRFDLTKNELDALVQELTKEMLSAAETLEFERAAQLRDRIRALQKGS